MTAHAISNGAKTKRKHPAAPPARRKRPPRADLREWASSLEYFKHVRAELWENPRYRGNFVGIRAKQVVDSDSDMFRLAERLRSRFADGIFFVTKVQLEDPVIDAPSTELV